MQMIDRIEKPFLPVLAKVFSHTALRELITRGRSDYFSEVVQNSHIMNTLSLECSLSDFLDSVFELLSRDYRNEYIYKSVLAEQIYWGEHFDDSRMLTELRVGACKADIAVFNGTSTVYEIKSDLDNLDRLDHQINAYLSFFDKIYVVSSELFIDDLTRVLNPIVGIMTVDPNDRVKCRRKATSNRDNVSPSVIFESLRRREYLKIIHRRFGFVPEVPNTLIHDECLKLFSSLTPACAHDEMLDTMCQRNNSDSLKRILEMVPRSLRAFMATESLSESQYNNFSGLLSKCAHSVVFQVAS